jgi:FKBP-type peptidyl-prolyl cis-trans isomerase
LKLKPIAVSLIAGSLLAGAAHAQTAPAAVGGAAYLAAMAKTPGVITLPSGLEYKVVQSGPAGPSPKAGDVIKVQYEGAFPDGKVFDATPAGKSALMPLDSLVPAWMEAIPKMHAGDEWVLYVPPALGYGERGAGPIAPNSVLVFKVKLVAFLGED